MAVSMKEAVLTLQNIMEENDLHYQYNDEDKTFSMSFSLRNTKLSSVRVVVRVVPRRENPEQCFRLMSHGLIGIRADEESISEMAEFLHRANFGMIFGCFELDFNDGEIRFRMSINCSEVLPGAATLEDLWDLPVMMTDRYGNGILAVSMGLLTAAEAIERIEGE